MGLHKILKIVALLLSIAGVVSLAMIVSNGDDAVKATGEGLDGFLYIAYIMFALVLFFVVIFVLKGLMAGDMNPSLVAGGIKVALLTTVFGLVVAIILQIFYNYIIAKIDSIVNSMEDASITLIDMLVDYNNKK